jgi:hypothetical protein
VCRWCGGGAGHAEAEFLGHRSTGALIDQQQHRFAAAQGQADAGRLPLVEIGQRRLAPVHRNSP